MDEALALYHTQRTMHFNTEMLKLCKGSLVEVSRIMDLLLDQRKHINLATQEN